MKRRPPPLPPVFLLPALLLLHLAAGAGRLFASTVPQYDHALAQVQASLEARIPALEAHEIPSGLPPQFVARRVLLPIRSVGPDGGTQQPVRNGQLWQQLADADRHGDVAQLRALDRQIATLRAGLSPAAAGGAAGAAPDPVRAAHAVLTRPEFGSDPFPPPSLSERAANWVNDWLRRLFRAPSRSSGSTSSFSGLSVSPGFIRGLSIVMLTGAAAVLVAVLVQVLSRREGRARPGALLDGAEAALVEARDTDSLLALAERQAQEGNYRGAFRLIYVATLVRLDTTGVLRFDRSKTNWEYLRALRSAGRDDVYAAMTPLTREFDRVWYGSAAAGLPEYARAVAQYKALQAAPAPAAPAPRAA